jgi:hypothetical protein
MGTQGVRVFTATGAVAVAATFDPHGPCTVLHMTYHGDGAVTTEENLTVTLDANAGAAYDTVLTAIDMNSQTDTQNVTWTPTNLVLANGDKLVVAFPNTETNTYGLSIYYKPYID